MSRRHRSCRGAAQLIAFEIDSNFQKIITLDVKLMMYCLCACICPACICRLLYYRRLFYYRSAQDSSATAAQLNVAMSSPARDYKIGIARPDGSVENNPTFYLEATSGFYSGEFAGSFIDDETTNWIGYVAINGPPKGGTPGSPKGGPLPEGGRDIAIVFRGTQVILFWCTLHAAAYCEQVSQSLCGPFTLVISW